jgi:hypothetical protein
MLITAPLAIGVWCLAVSGQVVFSISGVCSTFPASKNARFYIIIFYLIMGILIMISVFTSYIIIIISSFKQLSRNLRDLNMSKQQIIRDKIRTYAKINLNTCSIFSYSFC